MYCWEFRFYIGLHIYFIILNQWVYRASSMTHSALLYLCTAHKYLIGDRLYYLCDRQPLLLWEWMSRKTFLDWDCGFLVRSRCVLLLSGLRRRRFGDVSLYLCLFICSLSLIIAQKISLYCHKCRVSSFIFYVFMLILGYNKSNKGVEKWK